MVNITKSQVVSLLAQKYNGKRQEGETNAQLVKRIRDARRTGIDKYVQERYELIDNQLKKEALEEYYNTNPEEKETVADFE